MSSVVRRGGRVTQTDGSALLWSVADGRRGRRWRVGLVRGGHLVSSMLLQVSPDGWLGRLELATSAGLLTLHPDANGELHGNAVTRDGVRHLRFAWSAEHELAVDGDSITNAVAARRLAASTPAGEGRSVPVVAVRANLAIRESVRTFHRVDAATWRIDGEDDPMTLVIDPDGIPRWSGEADTWPLQLDPTR